MLHVTAQVTIQRLLLRRSRVLFASSSSLWALVDQGIVSLGTFLTTLVLARSLDSGTYGIFVLILVTMQFAASTLSPLVGYPLIRNGASSDEFQYKALLADSLTLTLLIAIPASAILGASTLIWQRSLLVAALSGVALLAWLLQIVMRNAFIAKSRYAAMLLGDSVAYVGQGILILILVWTYDKSLTWALAGMAITSALAFCIQALQLRIRITLDGWSRHSMTTFWYLGRWMVLSAIVTGLVPQVLLLSLNFGSGKTEVASFQAAANVLGMTNPIMTSLTSVLIPAVAIGASTLQSAAAVLRTMIFQRTVSFMGLFLFVIAIVIIWPKPILAMMYGANSSYTTLDTPVRILSVAYLCFFSTTFCTAILNGLGHPKLTLLANAAGTLVVLIAGIPTIHLFGVNGASAAMVMVSSTSAAASALFLLKRVNSATIERSAITHT